MSNVNWRSQFATLLRDVATAVEARNDRQAAIALGTALAYLEKAQAKGDTSVGTLLVQLTSRGLDAPTERFSFAPGELEELKSRSNS